MDMIQSLERMVRKMEGNFILKVNKDSKPLSDEDMEAIRRFTYNGIVFYPASDPWDDDGGATPIPWDAKCNVENGTYVISGDMGPCDSVCKVRCELPCELVSRYIKMVVESIHPGATELLVKLFKGHNWDIEEEK